MCYGEEIHYRCGHRSLPVVRPCPMTTSGHNNPICQIQFTFEYGTSTMCVACERVLHSRWTLLQEWEHRWYHERGVCPCSVKFPDLDIRPHVIGAGTENTSRSDDETTLANSPTVCAADRVEMDKRDSPDIKTEHDGVDDNKQLIANGLANQNHRKGPVVIGGRQDQCPQDHIPALYEERTDNDKTHVAVRQASQYAAEWLEDHREMHNSGRCHCHVDTQPITRPDTQDNMTAEEEKVLTLHHQITGDGLNPGEWTPPLKEDIDRWRKETGVPELGTKSEYSVIKRLAPNTTKYPVPLGNNMYMTENFMVWDAKLLASRVTSMQITSNGHGAGAGSSAMVPNGFRPATQDPVYVYQPGTSGPSKETRKKGNRRASGRNWPRRDTVTNPQNADPFGHGSSANVLPGCQQQTLQTFRPSDQNGFEVAAIQMQQPVQNGPYDEQQAAQYGMPLSAIHQHGRNGIQGTDYRQQMQTQHAMPPNRSASRPEQENIPHNRMSNMAVTPPQQQVRTTPPGFHYIHGAENVIGWYLTPPNTHAGKGMDGKLPTSSSDTDQTPTKPSRKADQPAILPAATVNGSRASPDQNISGNGTSSGTTSAAVTPTNKRKKSATRKLKIKQKKEEERKKAEKQIAVKDNGDEQRCNVTPLCGLPIGAGPESSKPHMPAFEDCSLFYPAKKHRRGSSCPQFQDTQPLASVSCCRPRRD
jgi:hypothetical protein